MYYFLGGMMYFLTGWALVIIALRWEIRNSVVGSSLDRDDAIFLFISVLMWPLLFAVGVIMLFGKATEVMVNYGRK